MRAAALVLLLLTLSSTTSCIQFVRRGKVESSRSISVSLDELPEARLISGMSGCENIYLDPDSQRVYVTSLAGAIHLLDVNEAGRLEVDRTLEVDGYALGIDRGPDGNLYVAIAEVVSDEVWKEVGGSVARVDPQLQRATILTSPFPAINGVAVDDAGRCYFATSNFNFFAPEGAIYVMNPAFAQPELLVDGLGLANGVCFDRLNGRLLVADTLQSVTAYDLSNRMNPSPTDGNGRLAGRIVYRKTRFKEAFDDICVDGAGRIWMTDPIGATLKRYDPATDSLLSITVEGFGQSSSCRIRQEDGIEILYVTELVAPEGSEDARSDGWSGRGVLRVPVSSLP